MANAEQKVKVVGEKNLTSSFPNFRPFDSATSQTLFNMGTTRVTTNLVPAKVVAYKSRLVTTAHNVSLEDLRIKSLDKARIIRKYSDKILLRPDRTDFTSYSYFGSLVELLRVSINHIVATWPGSLYVNPDVENVGRLASVLSLSYESYTNTTTFQVPVVVYRNRFEINMLQGVSTYPDNDLRNFAQEFDRYELGYNGTTLPVIGFTGQTTSTSQFVTFKVKGKAFPDATTTVAFAREFHIQPNGNEIGLYLRGVTDLSRYLLNLGGEERFTALFRYPGTEDELVDQYVTWPSADSHNPDFEGGAFGDYQDVLFELAQTYDNHKTNLLIRRLVPASLLDHDQTYSAKMSQLLQAYGREFDKVKSFIDGLAHLNTVTYDRMNNAPDALVMNLARTLGWDTFPIASDETGVIDALFNANVKYGNTMLSPSGVDIELWRRVVMNSTWLLQSKGTRQALEAILGLVGAPEALVEFNEYIYLADRRMRVTTDVVSFDFAPKIETLGLLEVNNLFGATTNLATEEVPLFGTNKLRATEDSDLSTLMTATPSELDISGNFVSKNVAGLAIIPEPVQQLPDRSLIAEEPTNLEYPQPPLYIPFQQQGGENDYMQAVAAQGFTLKRVVDNKKSWNTSTGTTRDHALTQTRYEQGDSRLVVNSKEVGINLNPSRAVEYDVFGYIKENGFPLGKMYAAPYPQTSAQIDQDFNGMGFFEFVDKVNERFIDARNRKTSKTYPTLARIYLDYLKNSVGPQSSALTVARIMAFTRRVGTSWSQLIEQVLPASSILVESGLHVRNTVFDAQKFVYKPGIDAGSEFRTLMPLSADIPFYLAELETSLDEGLNDTIYVAEFKAEGFVSDNANITTSAFSSFETKMAVRPKCHMTVYGFTPPAFLIGGAEKILTGQTGSSNNIFLHDLTSTKDFTVLFQGQNADAIRGELGANVGVLFFPFDYERNTFSNEPIHRMVLDRSSVSGSTLGEPLVLSGSVSNNILVSNTEYLIKTFFIKTALIPTARKPEVPVLPLSYYEDYTYNQYPKQFRFHSKFYDRANQAAISAVTFSSEPTISITGLGLPYSIYDADRDYYFASVGKPVKPLFNGVVKFLTDYDSYFSGDTHPVTTIALTLRNIGIAKLYKNGIEMVRNVDYITTRGFVHLGDGSHFTLSTPLAATDIVRVTFQTFQETIESIQHVTILNQAALPSGTANPASATPWYNTTTSRLEIIIPSDPQPDSLTIEVNGVFYSGSQLSLSTAGPSTTAYALPSTATLPLNGPITARYTKKLLGIFDAQPLLQHPTQILIQVPGGCEANGFFEIDIAAETDLAFSKVITTLTEPFVENQEYFANVSDLSAVSGITPNTRYLIRIRAKNNFQTLTGQVIAMNSDSNIYKVRLGNLTNSTYSSGGSGGSSIGFNG